MFVESMFNEGDRVRITDPLTRSIYGTSGIVVAVVQHRGGATTLEVELDDARSMERLITLRADEVARA